MEKKVEKKCQKQLLLKKLSSRFYLFRKIKLLQKIKISKFQVVFYPLVHDALTQH